MKYAYFYIKTEEYNNCLKYGLKLSDNINKTIKLENLSKSGFVCYISPKDSCLYNDINYKCAKIDISDLRNVFVIDDTFENYDFYNEFIVEASKYTYGLFENPKILICTSVIPERIYKYNKLMDSPLPYDNSKDFYYLKKIYYLLDEKHLDLNESLDYLLHSMVDKNQIKCFSNEDESIQVFVDKNGKKYTVCK